MKTRTKVLLALGALLGLALLVGIAVPSSGRNMEYKPQDEFMVEPWVELQVGRIDMSINKGVFYLLLAALATTLTLVFIANRMQARPNRVQTLVEFAYEFIRNNITGPNNIEDRRMATKWFGFIAALFLFIWFSNMIGYLPLPVNTQETVNVFGVDVPSIALYAATANLSTPLILTLVVWFSYHVEGIRAKGFKNYVKGWIPAGTPRKLLFLVIPIEVISQFVRIISLSVRLFANLLSGHLLILFMGGGMVVLLGAAWIGVLTTPIAVIFFFFEIVLIASLQAFIFATLTAIYLGEAIAEGH
jgi:F-type H+-transporting ATPase subunit a